MKTIVRDKGMRDPELGDNVLPNKFLASMSLMFAKGSASTHLVK